jgi:hypothetical protein
VQDALVIRENTERFMIVETVEPYAAEAMPFVD